jgi:MerR family transcriptional regulator, repressor of the yfmOP operon
MSSVLAPVRGGLLSVAEAAAKLDVSPRTLRYYEELGLLAPAAHSAGGARRYRDADVARLLRIRELQELLGFDLGEIGDILGAEDRLADLRREYQGAAGLARRRAIVAEATQVNARLRSVVRAKQERLDEMMRALEGKARRYRARARELAEEAELADVDRVRGPV